ncbi:NAD-dependent protein deacetylase sirtuin-1-like [Acanthaster planci]|uniref:protein acetyllysine N-acetyltransferase n=1 Tax=Acanthaster planci TaxID=133434 RepID=A0A8B7XJW9_ACAPL|nr:NAD-dependent protein deacetylase sirtuin-1-like [Acanthaster planci]
MGWLQRQMMSGAHPRAILARLLPTVSASLPEDLDEFEVWSIIADYFQMLREPPRRKKLPDVNTFDDALNLLRVSKRIMVLTGAGVSVSCGIPDFRSRDGIYARLAVDFPDLPDPQAIFDIHYFRRNPRPFFKFAKEIYPGEFRPSSCHKFIALLEQHGKLLRNFSQNIDTLEQVAGITRVLQCHGSFATARCTNCNYQVDAEAIRADIFNQTVPLCPRCPQDPEVLAVMKPDIVFFGEGLPKDFYHCLEEDKEQVDLLIVIGSSLKVQPVATIPNTIPGHVPQILINREPLNHMNFDIELLGDGDVIVNEICRRLGESWDQICDGKSLVETSEMPVVPDEDSCNSADDEAEMAVTAEKLERGFEVADSTSWISGSERRQEEDHHLNEEQDVFQEVGDKSKAGETMNSSAPEKVVPGPLGLPETPESNNVGLTGKAAAETNISTSGNGRLDTCTSEMAGSQQEKRLSQKFRETTDQLHPPREPNSKLLRDQDCRDKAQESNGAQNSDISSTVYEDGSRTQDTEASVQSADNIVLAESGQSEISETNEALSQEAENSGKASGREMPGDASRSQDVTAILKTKDETTPSEARSRRKRRSSIALYLEASSYLFVPPNRYIFHGAEVFPPSKPASPHTVYTDGPDSDRHSPGHPENRHSGDDDSASHLADFVDHSETPSTSNVLMDDLLQGEALPKSEGAAVHCGIDATHGRNTSHFLRDEKLPTAENSELPPVKDSQRSQDISPAIHNSLLLLENSAFRAEKDEAVLPCSEKVDFR